MCSVKLDQKAIEALGKEVNGSGGHQSLMNKLKAQCDGYILKYDDNDLEKLKRYSGEYGDGGFQDRFKAILSCIDK